MKIRKLLLATNSLLIPVATISTSITSCNKAKEEIHVPEIKKMETRNAKIMALDPTSLTEVKYIESAYNLDIVHFNDSPVGYTDIELFMQKVGLPMYTLSTKDVVTTITNTYRNSSARIDYQKQTITFDNYDAFVDFNPNSYGPMMEMLKNGEHYWHSVKINKYIAGNATTIDLTKYNIPIYYKDGKGYLPVDLIRNVFGIALFLFGQYNGKNIYQYLNGNFEILLPALKKIREEGDIYNKDLMEFGYNLLALTLDFRFGLTQRQSRLNPGKTIQYLPKGAYEAMKPYHDRLVSLEPDVSNDALLDLFKNELDDGGHARYKGLNIFATKTYPEHGEWGPETAYGFHIDDLLSAKRKTASLDPASYWINQGKTPEWIATNEVSSYYTEYTSPGKSPIAYLTFDTFAGTAKNPSPKELEAKRELPEFTTAENYVENTFRLTMYANEQIRSHGVKDVVVDISMNGGGESIAELFIASWLCKGVTVKLDNPKNNAYCEFTVQADINGDKTFDENDYLPDDVNLYLIASTDSFSCGNLLSCQVCDLNKLAKIIGNKSGGGACPVDQDLYTGFGSLYRGSGVQHILRDCSSPQYRTSNDIGCEVHYYIDDVNTPEKYYDRTSINNFIWGI